MLIECSVCQDLIHASHNPLLIPCGHIYHEECLERWLAQKKSCPQCRASVRGQPVKVYFNVSEHEGLNESVADRLSACESECFDLKSRNKKLSDELALEQSKVETAHRKIVNLEGMISDNKCVIAAYQMTIEQLKAENMKVRELKKRLEKAEKESDSLASLKTILNGTDEAVKERLNNYACNEQSIRQLCLHVEVLRKQSEKYQQRCAELLLKRKPLETELSELKRIRLEQQHRIDELMRMSLVNRTSSPERSQDCEERDRSIIEVPDDSFDDILKENLLLPNGKEMKLQPSAQNERLKRKLTDRSGSNIADKRSHFQRSASSDYVYDGLGGSVRASSIVVPMTSDEKARAFQRAKEAAKSKRLAHLSRQSSSKPTTAASSSSLRNFLANLPAPKAPSFNESTDLIELD